MDDLSFPKDDFFDLQQKGSISAVTTSCPLIDLEIAFFSMGLGITLQMLKKAIGYALRVVSSAKRAM
ncbi:hypothetical protein B5V46_04240 [Rhodovulum sp. MB263]|nr:hypothetical protein B5V46_04240 [Rhodovulum sp. MB263]